MNVLSIGYGRHLFKADDPERKRIEKCAEAAGSLDMIVFTLRSDELFVTKTDVGLTLHPTNSFSRFTMMFDAFKIASKIIKTQPSLPLVTTQDPFETGIIGYLLKKKFGAHFTVQEHADAYSTPYWRQESLLNQVRFKIGIFILKNADTVRVVAERIVETLSKKYVQKERITKLPVSIDVSRFISAQPNSVVREIFPADSFVFLSVARFVPQKNFPLLIQSFAKVYESNPRARLLLVGTGPKEAEIKKQIGSAFSTSSVNDRPVQILPWSEDVAGLMKASDAYVLSSNYEGWARVLIEAMCTSLPIVTTDVGCANEVVKNNEHGYIVPLNDVEKLTEAMLKLLQDKTEHSRFKQNLQQLDVQNLPGANISEYGKAWVSTLK